MFPEDPSFKDNQRVKSLFVLLRYFPLRLLPPIHKRGGPSVRDQRDQVQGLQDCKTELSSKHKSSEDVLNCFLFLITKGAAVRVGESSFFVTCQLSNSDLGWLNIERFCTFREPMTSIVASMARRWWTQRNKLGRQIWLRRCLRIRASSDEHPPKH